MLDVEILLSENSSQQEKCDAATRIIETCDLTQEEVISVFKQARYNIRRHSFDKFSYFKNKFLFDTLLSSNINLFVAVAKAFFDGKIFSNVKIPSSGWYFSELVIMKNKFYNIGCCTEIAAVPIYCELLNYYNFDTDNLIIDKARKSMIKQYQQKKYGGKLTKVAEK